jgi:hypothetical protein
MSGYRKAAVAVSLVFVALSWSLIAVSGLGLSFPDETMIVWTAVDAFFVFAVAVIVGMVIDMYRKGDFRSEYAES